MNRDLLQLISRQRRQEAAALIRAGMYPGAYYLAGYSVECAFKACIAKQTNRHDFPDKRLAAEAWTHNLEKLLQLSGFRPELERDLQASQALQLNWTIVKDWSEQARYNPNITGAQARDFYSACTRRRTGVLPWIRERW